jgi:hypothetical protein
VEVEVKKKETAPVRLVRSILKEFDVKADTFPQGGENIDWKCTEGAPFSILRGRSEETCWFKAGRSEGEGSAWCTYTYRDVPHSSPQTLVKIIKPTGETPVPIENEVNVWGRYTGSSFGGVLEPTSVDFSGFSITEGDTGGEDSCHQNGDPSSWGGAYIHVTHADEILGVTDAKNYWKRDVISWDAARILRYRVEGRSPCSTIVHQVMKIVDFSWRLQNIPYGEHEVELKIDVTDLWNAKDGKSKGPFKYPR